MLKYLVVSFSNWANSSSIKHFLLRLAWERKLGAHTSCCAKSGAQILALTLLEAHAFHGARQ